MITKEIIALSVGLATSAFLVGSPNASRTTSQGVYTAAQVAQGRTLYKSKCAACHLATLKGKDENPPLVGKDFTSQWVGEPLSSLFDKIKNTMPADNPGTLTQDQTAELLAYILSSNQYPAGTTALPSDDQSLKQIQIVAPPSKSAAKAHHKH